MKLLENGLQPYPEVTSLFSMRTELLSLSQSCRSLDADPWCKGAITLVVHFPDLEREVTAQWRGRKAQGLLYRIRLLRCICD